MYCIYSRMSIWIQFCSPCIDRADWMNTAAVGPVSLIQSLHDIGVRDSVDAVHWDIQYLLQIWFFCCASRWLQSVFCIQQTHGYCIAFEYIRLLYDYYLASPSDLNSADTAPKLPCAQGMGHVLCCPVDIPIISVSHFLAPILFRAPY